MKHLIISFFQDFGVAIQTLTSLILLIVTIVYVIATFKMIHATQKTFLKPVLIETDDELKITVKNYGLGTAINIKLYIESRTIDEDLIAKGYLFDYIFELFKEHYLLMETENFEVEPNKSIDFRIPTNFKIGDKLVLYWESISGEKSIIRYQTVLPVVGKIKINEYKRIKVKSLRNFFLNPIQFVTRIIESTSFYSPYEDYMKEREKENRK
ncbi:hypothetical protein [Paenibacillus rhizophilus]|uniref:Uncharacterized protein n=1 Tax=Paenibacillus rhizophilus TaxID=1850366 RepID=A0A3N9PA94_9BACL|nr:hypothetical protein [Paenibacillus rhizophilus]RQW12247.1 hypothetical protein EH198_07780 [Paenibacillus rhizophilus]